MSLDITLTAIRPTSVFEQNITHNLVEMAEAAGLYAVMWRPDENGVEIAAQALPILEAGLAALKADPERFKALNPSNGWGTYGGFVKAVEAYIEACHENPDATIEVSR